MSCVSIRRMTTGDLGFCLKLMRMTGWGLTFDDLRRMLSYESDGCFIASLDGADVGMVGSTSYCDVGWVGNLVVLPQHRGLGIGASLMRSAIQHLKDAGVSSISLDSVEKAIPLYRRLGFTEEYLSLRFTGVGRSCDVTGVEAMLQADLPDVLELDGRFFGASRARMLSRVLHDFPDLCYVARIGSRMVGFIMAKDGEGLRKIGPWICEPGRPGVADALLQKIMDESVGGKLWVGVPEGNKASVEILGSYGFEGLPSSTRMCRGDCTPMGDVRGVFGIGAVDKG